MSERVFVGIDPGFKGAIAVINEDGECLYLADLPVTGGKGRQKQFDSRKIMLKAQYAAGLGEEVTVGLEKPNSQPGEAAQGAHRFGEGIGLVKMAFESAGCEVVHVSPNLWKGRLGLPGVKADKDAKKIAMRLARELFPSHAAELRYVTKHDGRAEALLIAVFMLCGSVSGLHWLREKLGRERAMVMLMGRPRHRKGGTRGVQL